MKYEIIYNNKITILGILINVNQNCCTLFCQKDKCVVNKNDINMNKVIQINDLIHMHLKSFKITDANFVQMNQTKRIDTSE